MKIDIFWYMAFQANRCCESIFLLQYPYQRCSLNRVAHGYIIEIWITPITQLRYKNKDVSYIYVFWFTSKSKLCVWKLPFLSLLFTVLALNVKILTSTWTTKTKKNKKWYFLLININTRAWNGNWHLKNAIQHIFIKPVSTGISFHIVCAAHET